MKKKGFTLIELLAVIVILAIIALIATPLVLKYIEKSRQESKVDSAYSYVRNLETEIANYSIKNNGKKYNKSGLLEIGELTDIDTTVKGDTPSSGKVCLSSLGQVDKAILQYDKYYVLYDGKRGSISDKDTYDNFSCNGNGVADSFESIYNYGDEVTFNPGDGDRTWNVIGEDKESVTLLLAENIGGSTEWYSVELNSGDNNLGPKVVLDYLNGLTVDWNNVDPIASYSYVNNLNGNTKSNGYQKIDIKDGDLTLFHKDGNYITLDSKSKARLLTIEELLEIASKTNENLTKENLKGYITKNLNEINTAMGISAVNADEAVDKIIELKDYTWISHETEHAQLYFIVEAMVFTKKIDSTYDILFPNYFNQNLDCCTAPYGYWILSSRGETSEFAWVINHNRRLVRAFVFDGNGYSVCPVITIPKSKL